MTTYKLAKFIAHAGYCSRRNAEELILNAQVIVNGETITNCATVVSDKDKISVSNNQISIISKIRLWIYHKPRGVLTTHSDPQGRPTVFSQLPKALPRLISIGRLDYNTEGLLLLTNSPVLAHKLESPKLGLIRRYKCRIFGKITPLIQSKLNNGITIDGVVYRSIKIEFMKNQGDNNWIIISLTEGKNREIRRVMEYFGIDVSRLIRLQYGKFFLNNLTKSSILEIDEKFFGEYNTIKL